LNRHLSQNLPFPLFAKEGDSTSLWRLFPAGGRQREVGRDSMKQCRYYYEAVDIYITLTPQPNNMVWGRGDVKGGRP